MMGRRWRAHGSGSGGRGAAGVGAAFFDDGVEFADGVVNIGLHAADATTLLEDAGGFGVGASTGRGREP
jgi:hypothetical protein